jgi:hypothetical protein
MAKFALCGLELFWEILRTVRVPKLRLIKIGFEFWNSIQFGFHAQDCARPKSGLRRKSSGAVTLILTKILQRGMVCVKLKSRPIDSLWGAPTLKGEGEE